MSSSDSVSGSASARIVPLLMITILAVLIQGYHLGVDDAAIYVPGIKQVADPALYPYGAEFFQSHAKLTLFPNLVGGSARLTHLPIDLIIFVWHLVGVFLLLLAGWRLLSACFEHDRARWAGVVLLAVLLSVPVAGTALAIADPYVTSRTLSTPATMLAIACFVSGRRKQAAGWWLFTAVIHPQMSVYAAVFLLFAVMVQHWNAARARETPAAIPAYFAGLPFLFDFQPSFGPAREALFSRTYFFVSQWAWYEWIGVFGPLALLVWFTFAPLRGSRPAFRLLAQTLIPFGLSFTLAGLALTASPRLENYTRLQPMRSLHLLYVIFFLLAGGVLGEYVLARKVWRWLGLFIPLGIAMWLLQMSAYPASPHVEWPGTAPSNPWTAAFLWIRNNTPKNAVFALDANYMLRPGEDMHGFRALAERSTLADAVKDSGAVSLFPGLADHWKAQVDAVRGWRHFRLTDFASLRVLYPVTWIVTEFPGPAGVNCPYRNKTIAVCRF